MAVGNQTRGLLIDCEIVFSHVFSAVITSPHDAVTTEIAELRYTADVPLGPYTPHYSIFVQQEPWPQYTCGLPFHVTAAIRAIVVK